MAQALLNIDPQRLETNCSKRLFIFVNQFKEHTIALKRNLAELQKICGILSSKAKQFEQLHAINDENLKSYSTGDKENILGSIEFQASSDIAEASNILRKMQDSHKSLVEEHKHLLTAVNALQIAFSNSPLFMGNSRQKPIKYYVDEAFLRLRSWNLFMVRMQIKLCCFQSNNFKKFEELEKLANTSSGWIQNLDDYLMLCSFLISHSY